MVMRLADPGQWQDLRRLNREKNPNAEFEGFKVEIKEGREYKKSKSRSEIAETLGKMRWEILNGDFLAIAYRRKGLHYGLQEIGDLKALLDCGRPRDRTEAILAQQIMAVVASENPASIQAYT